MSLWAIVPVKALRQGKSRLSKVLTEEQRTSLNQKMLKRTLEILSEIDEIDQVLVVSKDPDVLALAHSFKVKTLQENGQPGLNNALEKATAVANVYKANSILILPADLPILCSEDIKKFIHYSEESPEVIIAPDRRNEGTNALIVKPTGAIHYQFGENSYQKHLQEAKEKEIPIKTCDLDSIELDLDLPEDLEYLRSVKSILDFEPF